MTRFENADKSCPYIYVMMIISVLNDWTWRLRMTFLMTYDDEMYFLFTMKWICIFLKYLNNRILDISISFFHFKWYFDSIQYKISSKILIWHTLSKFSIIIYDKFVYTHTQRFSIYWIMNTIQYYLFLKTKYWHRMLLKLWNYLFQLLTFNKRKNWFLQIVKSISVEFIALILLQWIEIIKLFFMKHYFSTIRWR